MISQRSPHQAVATTALLVAAWLPKNVLAENILEIEIDDLLILGRYLIGLAFVTFGLFFLLYKDYATILFLKQYDESRKVTGLVISCRRDEPVNNNVAGQQKGGLFQGELIYSAELEAHQLRRKKQAPAIGAPLLQQEYLHRFRTNWQVPQGSTMDIYLIPKQPRSAITKAMLDAGRKKISCASASTILVPGLALAFLFIGLSVRIIVVAFPDHTKWIGWLILVLCASFIVLASWSICDFQFVEHARETYFSSYPVQRVDSHGNIVASPPPPTTVFVTAATAGTSITVSTTKIASSNGTTTPPSPSQQCNDLEGTYHSIV